MGLPISIATSRASVSASSRSSCASSNRIAARSRPDVAGQAPSSKVARAAAIARSTSSTPERGATATSSPVDGSRLSNVSPDVAGDHSPPM